MTRLQVHVRVGSGRMMLDGDQVQLPVVDASFGDHRIGEPTDLARLAPQDHALDAVLVIEVSVHRGHRQVVMLVLQPRETLGQIPLMVVVDVGQIRDAVRARVTFLAQPIEVSAQDVAHRFGPVAVAALLDQPIELVREIVIERNGEAFHGVPAAMDCRRV